MDFFNICAVFGFIIVSAVLSTATTNEPADMRQASMPQTIILFLAGGLLCIVGVMHRLRWKTPVPLSSAARGQVPRPEVYILVEDIVAVDGDGKDIFREKLAARYEASPVYCRLLVQLNWFWGIGSVTMSAITTMIIYTVNNIDVIFALGKCNPTWSSYCLTTSQDGPYHGYGEALVHYSQSSGRRGCCVLSESKTGRLWHRITHHPQHRSRTLPC